MKIGRQEAEIVHFENSHFSSNQALYNRWILPTFISLFTSCRLKFLEIFGLDQEPNSTLVSAFFFIAKCQTPTVNTFQQLTSKF